MLEILKVIVLVCQVNAGGDRSDAIVKMVDNYQLKCQKELIKCYDGKQNAFTYDAKLKYCLMNRKVQ